MSPTRLLLLVALAATRGVAANIVAMPSPFLPTSADATALAAPAPIEFTGYLVEHDGARFRVGDPARRTLRWIRLNEADPEIGVVARRHDAEQELLFVEYQGRALTLTMRRPKITGAPAPTPGLNSSTPLAPASTADQQKQLENLASAIAQRRALREQAAIPAPGSASATIPVGAK